jgi:hypothetical protein
MPRDGVVEQDTAILDQHHHRDRGEGLGHRVQAEDRVLGHRRARLRIALAERLEIDDLAPPGHQPDRARVAALGDLALHDLGDAGEPRRGEADLLRLRARQPLRQGEPRRGRDRYQQQRDEPGGDGERALHDVLLATET